MYKTISSFSHIPHFLQHNIMYIQPFFKGVEKKLTIVEMLSVHSTEYCISFTTVILPPIRRNFGIYRRQTAFWKTSFERELNCGGHLHSFYKIRCHIHFRNSEYRTTSPQGRDVLIKPVGVWHLRKDKLGFQFWKVTLIALSQWYFCHDEAMKYIDLEVVLQLTLVLQACLFLALSLPSRQ